jgi:histidinol dehydrogenase
MTDAATIVADVRDRGDAALREWAERLGDGAPELVTPRGELDVDTLHAVRALIGAV